MDVTTHSMDPRIARIHYQDYRKRVSAQREERKRTLAEEASRSRKKLYQKRKEMDALSLEDEEMLAMYKAMSQGKRVLVLNEVFAEVGVDDDFVPNIAIARADWKWCYFGVTDHTSGYNKNRGPFFSSKQSGWDHTKQTALYLPNSFFPGETTNNYRRNQADSKLCRLPVKAMVPTIPPYLRPDRPEKYWLLWEPEWDKSVPDDPILLRRLNVYTFSVVAQWDLSPLERSVLFGRPS